MTTRPFPPRELIEAMHDEFAPASNVERWAFDTFINEGAELQNEDHAHLQQASVGFLWTNVENVKKGRLILGNCAIMPPSGDKWSAGRAAKQIEEWFGDMPDFMITLHAPSCLTLDNATFMALVEHELYHAAQAEDKYGAPAFSKETGKPIWTTRGHDIEQFYGVVRRYGADAAMIREMVRLANKGPEIAQARIDRVCGTCLRLVN